LFIVTYTEEETAGTGRNEYRSNWIKTA